MKHLIIALILLLTVVPAFADNEDKVDICHFDLDFGVWEPISISGAAVEKHFENHDDGLPGSATLGTVTSLDASCVPSASLLTCPCWSDFTETALVEFIDGWPNEDCDVFDFHGISEVDGYPVLDGRIRSGYDSSAKAFDQGLYAKISGPDQAGDCRLTDQATDLARLNLDSVDASVCHNEWESVVSQVTVCTN